MTAVKRLESSDNNLQGAVFAYISERYTRATKYIYFLNHQFKVIFAGFFLQIQRKILNG